MRKLQLEKIGTRLNSAIGSPTDHDRSSQAILASFPHTTSISSGRNPTSTVGRIQILQLIEELNLTLDNLRNSALLE
jgi:hypothetical protein